MMSLWDALRMNMMISYQELVRTFLSTDYNYTFLLFCVMMLPLLAFYRLVYIFWAGMMPAFFYAFINVRVITPAVWRNNH